MALNYCKKCGRIIQNTWSEDNLKCDCCHYITHPVPSEFLDNDLDCFFKDDKTERQFIEKYIKASSEFDQYLFDYRDEILAKQSADFNAKMEHGKAVLEEKSRSPKCPTCQSTNIKKVSATSKVASVAMFGLLSQKVKKQFHCNNCGYEW